MPDPENMGIAVGILMLSSVQAEINNTAYVFPVMAAIFDLPLTPLLDSVHNSPTELLHPETVGVAFGILFLSSTEVEIMRYFIFASGNGSHL